MAVSITENSLTITPSREKGLAYLYLRELIADSTYWQAMVDDPDGTISELETIVTAQTASRGNALAQISIERIDDEGIAISYPSCIIRYATGEEIASRFGPGSFDVNGAFFIEFMSIIPRSYRDYPSLAAIDSAEKFDAIEQELMFPITDAERLVIDSFQLLRQGAVKLESDSNEKGEIVRVSEYMVKFESAQA